MKPEVAKAKIEQADKELADAKYWHQNAIEVAKQLCDHRWELMKGKPALEQCVGCGRTRVK